MTRLTGILLAAVGLVVVIIIAISALNAYVEQGVYGKRKAPMQALMLQDGTVVAVYDIAITGQPCLLAASATGVALSCDWTTE